MKRALLLLLSIAFCCGWAFAGMMTMLVINPEVTIDEGWTLAAIGLSWGLAIGVILTRIFWRRRRRLARA